MTPPAQQVSRLRTRTLALARQMDWFRGLRAAVALCAPLVLGDLAGIPNMGWAGLGGFEAILADTGGPYRSRTASLATLSLGGAAGLFLGSITGASLYLALPTTILFCFLWSYLAVLGQPFSSAGVLVQVIFICGIGAPTANWHEALNHALLLLAGGAWAALLSLLLWPLDAYRPARFAVAACYTDLASFLASITELAARARQSPSLWHRLAQHHQYRVRRAVEHGWESVAAIRAEHQAETAQGHQLVVLLEHADLLIARTVALAEHLEAQSAETACDDSGFTSLSGLRAAELFVAQLLTRRGPSADAAQAQRLAMQRLPGTLAACASESSAVTRFLLAQVTEAASLLDSSIESASILRLGQSSGFKRTPRVPRSLGQSRSLGPSRSVGHFGYVHARLAELRQGWRLTRILDQLRANFTGKSLLLRHAARVALVCGLDVAIILTLRINHGYWLLMTSLIVLQPHVSGTMRRSLERIGGTVAGGILAAVLAVALHSQLATAAALFPLALLALAILPVSYAAFAFFLTPAFVLAWLPYSGDWQLAAIRTGNTIAGALISLAAMAFLFPVYERDRAPEFLRASIAADRRYLAQLADNWRSHARSGSASGRLLANARRSAGLAHNDTEESLERLLAESWPRRRPFAQFVAAFVTYLRRFAQSVTTLSTLDGEWQWKLSRSVRNRLALLNMRMEWLEAQTGAEPEQAPWPDAAPGVAESSPETVLVQTAPAPVGTESALTVPEAVPDHPGERQLERMERQAEVLHRQLAALRRHGWIPGAPRTHSVPRPTP
jgi:uncharacterized membrane protein YccC